MTLFRWMKRAAARVRPVRPASGAAGRSVSASAPAHAAAHAEDHAAADPGTRALDRRQAVGRATLLALTIVALALTARAVVGERGLLDAQRSMRELSRAEEDVDRWRERNAWLEKRIKALREDPATIEAMARERLDYVRPGEITFLFPDDPAKPEPGEPAPVAPGEFSPILP